MTLANAGFLHTCQFVNVGDYNNRGEHSPSPFYYQNLGEAEMIVGVFVYMVMMGYDPKKITILATYNGQVDLIKDILNFRCGGGRGGLVEGKVRMEEGDFFF